MAWTREQVDRLTRNVPGVPGVYIMRDREGNILYIGKAVDLRARVGSYFHESGDPRPFVKLLSGVLDRIDTVVTTNEKEALLLENELIKRHKPPFNVFLRDDKSYLYLRIDPREPFPRLDLVRRRRKDGALYFGPHHTASSVRGTHALVNRYFGLRTCKDRQFANRSRPCLEHQVGRCLAPCCGKAGHEEYSDRVKSAIAFLKGRHSQVVKELEERMLRAAETENFEEAARLRDQVSAVRQVLSRQAVVLPKARDTDVVGFARDGECAAFSVLRFESGVMVDHVPFVLEGVPAPDSELFESFLVQYYDRAPVPEDVLVPQNPVLPVGILEDILGSKAKKRVRVMVPARGPRKDAVSMAGMNAAQALHEALVSGRIASRALERVAAVLGLKAPPSLIEAYDMSNLFTAEPVGAMVVFEEGRPARRAYRTFAVRGEEGPGDVGCMREVLRRRFTGSGADRKAPDLILLDGGLAQLLTVKRLLEELSMSHVPVAALAKSRVVDRGSGPARHSPERLYVLREAPGPGEPGTGIKPVIPPRNDPGLHLLMRIRDEAHRFAVTFHRKRRRKRTTGSALDGIPGLGPRRKTTLLRKFGSVARIRAATLEELTAVPGLPANVARAVHDKLHEPRSGQRS